MKSKILFTDGEGPIVFKDLAADIMDKTVPGLFPILSLYDDFLAEIERDGYQAGDTLALVVPHLLLHGVTDKDVADEARDAKVCLGVEDYIAGLKRDGWVTRIISTAYSQLWELVGGYLGIPMTDIACTTLDLEALRNRFGSVEFNNGVQAAEKNILSFAPLGKEAADEVENGRSVVEVFDKDEKFSPLRGVLDQLYWYDLPKIGYKVLEEVRVMGGQRKVEAANGFARDLGVKLSDIAYVGDSITDDAVHKHLKAEGGLPIAINGNEYALRNARVAVATTDMRGLRPILDAWQRNGFDGVQRRAGESAISFGSKEGGRQHIETQNDYQIVDFGDLKKRTELIAVHKEFRIKVRGAAARFG